MSKTDMLRVTRLRQAFSNTLGEAAAERVMAGSEALGERSVPRKMAAWAHGAMERLDALGQPEAACAALRACGAQCAGAHTRGFKPLAALYRQTGDLDAVLEVIQQGAHGYGYRREGETVYLTYERCFCSLVRAAERPLSSTYCQCSCGYAESVWETILGHPVRVTLQQSVVSGAPGCVQAVDTHYDPEVTNA